MRFLVPVCALALSACAQPALQPLAPPTGVTRFSIVAVPVPLNPKDLAQDRIGDFRYAGGLELTSPDTSRFHWLSDMTINAAGQMTAVGDEGDVVEARIVLDKAGRLVGLTNGRLWPLTDLEAKPIQGKMEGDAEGLALLANGDLLVSFEQRHRIWLYPAKGGPARVAPMPQTATPLPANGGLEALGADPAAGPDAYVAGAEESGQTWTCKVSSGCAPDAIIAKPPEFGLVAVARLPHHRTAWLLRAWDKVRGTRVTLLVRDETAEVARMDLAEPLTRDNLEGLAAIPGKDGNIRFYIVSDDNYENGQRTLLLAFDWKPKT